MSMNHVRLGAGKPLLLIHGLGGNWRSWTPILDGLTAEREVIGVDLPGFGETAPLKGEVSIRTLSDAVTAFIKEQGLDGIDVVGSSMGARLVLELARRGGVVGNVVSLDPGGFWEGWQRHFFYTSIRASVGLVRRLQKVMPLFTDNPVGRTALFSQFSAHPWTLDPKVVLGEMRAYAASPSLDELLRNLAFGETQEGMQEGSATSPLVIGWGDRDRVCFPSQSRLALKLFPDARLHWFKRCGHFPMWDSPVETTRLILGSS